MKLFDAASTDYPRQWRDMSLDFRLMFVYHGCMMLLFMTGQALSTRFEIGITATLAAVLVSIAIRYRREMNWQWRGASAMNVLAAIGGILLTTAFLFAGTPLFPPSDHRFLPWYLAGAGIAIFGVLGALQVVCFSKDEFLKHCESSLTVTRPAAVTRSDNPAAPVDPTWKRLARALFIAMFFLIWIDGVASFYYFGVAFRHGSPGVTATNTEPLNDHGHFVFVSRDQKLYVDRLQTIEMVGIPLIFVVGFVVHFILGVKLVPNAPTLVEWRANRRR